MGVAFTLAELSPDRAYALTSALVVPRPIAFVSTLSIEGIANLAPFSFFMLGGPASVCISVGNSRNGEKDTARNIRATGEFVINLIDRPMAEDMNRTSAMVAEEVDEWSLTEFIPEKSDLIQPMRISEAPASMECKLFSVVDHGANHYIIADILRLHVRNDLMDGDAIAVDKVAMLARLGGEGYLDLGVPATFNMTRPS